ncbi:PREDICTED: mitochondrial inner membrane protease subunit 1-like [Priapulus caudatus]|uniref:Mitochondrial inner membrane protease subunit n=1 Tax=Priapulus caudatus TaxID=37621 RepID=A0ABM1DQV5_PRICU|nr:PREDICTED: mitochondrial inner membrane protease subunit 1-like [Priapulus caudatus]XP_014662327.1 PREDICTED: mitochondrial inner membrane protease subunit 1-like [Priapulus caudatus]
MSIFATFRRVLYKGGVVALCVVQYGCIAHCALEYGADFVLCSGPSMEPTITTSDIVLTEHITTALNRTKRGDVVIARSPVDPRQHICKRVVAVPGDKISKGFFTEYVPRGHVWLEGDNHNNSTDSRSYGPVPEALLRGRVICKVWPLRDAGWLSARQ